MNETPCHFYNGYGKKYGIWYVDAKEHKAHRLVYEIFHGPIPDGKEVDHKCGNKLCINPDHLRAATRGENMRNKGPYKGRRFKGVYRLPSGRYSASIQVNGKQTYLGAFDTEVEAAAAYNQRASELHGEFAKLNILEKR